MLAEKIIWCGYNVEPGFYGLAGITKRYLYKELDKSLQTSFDVDTFNVEQIYYAANDVKDLGAIRRLQITSLQQANLLNVMALENEAVCGFSEIEFNGMKLDVDAWRDNIKFADPIISRAAKKLDEFLRTEEFKQPAIELGLLTDKDALAINWNSTLQRKLVFSKVFPELLGFTKPIIQKYIKSLDIGGDRKVAGILDNYLEKNYYPLELYILDNYQDWLLENNLLIPADSSQISWTSGKQALKALQIIYPKLKSVSKEALSDCEHPIIEAYHEFLNTTKLKTTYGEKFIEEHVDSDGRVRTNFNQVLNTGRVSSSKPNIQNIPAKETLEIRDESGNVIAPYTRYRNAFIADKGWHFVDSDYRSQEAVLVASFSGDSVWMNAITNEWDLHSVCAEVVFLDKWKDAAQQDCWYYYGGVDKKGNVVPAKSKCNCKKHKTLRTLVKTINFGLKVL